MRQTAGEMMIEEFGKRIADACDELFERFVEVSKTDREHDLALTAMALGAVSAATGMIMEIHDEEYAKKVIRQSAKIIHKTLEVKRTRDTL